MTALFLVIAILWTMSLGSVDAGGADFGPAEDALSEVKGLRYENVYTKVPTSGRLASIKITDGGRIYYICREKTGYAIYHLEIRPIEGFREKIEQEIKEKNRQWDSIHPDELLFTKERHKKDLINSLRKYCEAVWVRNEIIVETPPPERNR
jgi:hypothetical protein